jgi:adenylate cyclase
MLKFRSVRAKLMTLVALSALATLAVLPILHWVMTHQLLDIVDDRVPDAVRGFDLELEDDVRDLEAATKSLADSDELENALRDHDAKAAAEELRVFHETYAGMSLLALLPDGKTLAEVGAPSYRSEGTIPNAAEETRTIRHDGCSPSSLPKPAYVVTRRARRSGFVAACMTIDETYLQNSATKLVIELAALDAGAGANVVVRTPAFPVDALHAWTGSESLVDSGGKAWALARFEPAAFRGVTGAFPVVAALDMTRIRSVLRRNLALTVGVLVFAALAAVLMGGRLADTMSRAVSRLNTALKRLEQAEYVHVVPVKTGDEIEDLADGFNTMVDGLRERDKLRTTFGKYMTQTVMDHLLKGKVALGGETLTVTILFTDIRSFTTISESMSAHELVALLNEYFTEMVGVVIQESGVVDKYIGDAIMAVFGAPVPKADDAVRAVRAAVRMREGLVKLNERLAARGKPIINTGIGIHTGEVVAGNIGSEARMEYTVIGDAVNLASRLESSTKELNAAILISDDTFKACGDEFETRPIREITVKGRTKPVMTYEVLGWRTRTSSSGVRSTSVG